MYEGSVTTPPPHLVQRFTRDLGAFTPGTRLGLAVSGGPDSLALFLLAHAAFPDRIEAATVDHGLRPEAADEAAAVARLCAALGVPHATLSASVAPGGPGLQANARHARYAALGRWIADRDLPVLLTAHHADDQAETLLMRLNRGSGVGGLAGIRPRGPLPGSSAPGGPGLVRPLLAWRRAELAAIVADAGLRPAQDPSNLDPAFDRARLRAQLADAPWLDPAALARAAAHLADAEEALAWTADRLWAERARVDGGSLALDGADLPPELELRLLRRSLATLAPNATPRSAELLRLRDTLQRGDTAILAGVLARGGRPWCFSLAPARRG